MKSYFLLIIHILVVAIAILVGKDIYNRHNSIVRCMDDELSSYNKDVFINGERVEGKLLVVVYNNETYFSVDMLRNKISVTFISQLKNSIKIRRNEINPVGVLQSENHTFVAFDVLVQYVHINNDILNSSGNIYIDTLLPASVNINGSRFYITNEYLSSSVFSDRSPDIVLSDGRGVWRADDIYYIEDDWGNYYKYIRSQNSIS